MNFLFLGTALNGLVKIWSVLKNFKFFMQVLKNWNLIHESQKVLTGIILTLVKEKRLPHCSETQITLGIFKKLLDADLVDIPGVDENELARMFDEVSSQLICAIENEKSRNLAKRVTNGQ